MRYRSSLAYNQLLITHIMSKIFFMKYLPPVKLKVAPKLKMLRIYWNLAHVIFRISWSRFWWKKIFFKYLPPVWCKLVPKLKVIKIYWNLACSVFPICQSRFWCQKCFFIKYLPIARPQLVPKWKMLKIHWNLIKIFDKNYFWH